MHAACGWAGIRGSRLRLCGKLIPLEDGARVQHAEALRSGRSIFLRNQVIGKVQQGRPGFEIVRIRGKKVDPLILRRPVRDMLRLRTKRPTSDEAVIWISAPVRIHSAIFSGLRARWDFAPGE